jgi:anti-anti-sigma factor
VVAVVRDDDRPRVVPTTSDVMFINAPAALTSETREWFRQAVLDLVARAAEQRVSVITIDLSGTGDVDASGLGVLVLAQRRAREHRITVRLVGVHADVRRVMELTRLDYLFHIAA